MKTVIFCLVALLAGAGAAGADPVVAEPDRAPFINAQIREITAKVDADLAAGTLTTTDGDELKRAVDHVKSVEESEPTLTPRTRMDLREQLAKIAKDLERKEAQAKALGSPSPSASP